MINVNSNKKKFASIEQLKKYVKDKGVVPFDFSSEIIIEKSIISTLKIQVKPKKIDKEHIILFLKKMVTDIKNGIEVYSSNVDMFYSQWFSSNLINTNLGDILNLLPKKREDQKEYDKYYYINQIDLKKFTIDTLQYIIDNYDNIKDKITLTKNITDYKTAHSYGINICGFVIMKRKEDIIVDSSPVVGRNVNHIASYILNNEDIDKILKWK